MFLAHARGLLKPGYSQGIRSIIRENLLLRQIDREIDGKVYMTRAVMESNFLQVVSPAYRSRIVDSAVGLLNQAGALLTFTPYKKVAAMSVKNRDEHELNQSVAVLKILKKSDYFDKMAEFLNTNTT